jgi:hypothetical protein
MSSHEYNVVAPVAYGNEEEASLMLSLGHPGTFAEPSKDEIKELQRSLPEGITSFKSFLSNGSRLYGDMGDSFLEFATAECATPRDLTTRIRSSELLFLALISNRITELSESSDDEVVARIQRRVIDSVGRTKGSHDNFGVNISRVTSKHKELKPTVLGHMATRSFVTGAGFVDNDQLLYAQKIKGLRKTKDYGASSSMYRKTAQMDEGERIEIRCNDINISEWATRVRVGSAALAFMIAQTPFTNGLEGFGDHDKIYEEAQEFNQLELRTDGTIVESERQLRALAYQQMMADISLDGLERHAGPLDDDLHWVAEELMQYCVDYRKVLNGDADVSILANRADWAAKSLIVLRDHEKRSEDDLTSSIDFVRARALDLKYDNITLKAQGGKLQIPDYGFGYRLRDNGHFRYTAPADEAQDGVYHPPRDTRAFTRAEIIRQHHDSLEYIAWGLTKHVEKGRYVITPMSDLLRVDEPIAA